MHNGTEEEEIAERGRVVGFMFQGLDLLEWEFRGNEVDENLRKKRKPAEACNLQVLSHSILRDKSQQIDE